MLRCSSAHNTACCDPVLLTGIAPSIALMHANRLAETGRGPTRLWQVCIGKKGEGSTSDLRQKTINNDSAAAATRPSGSYATLTDLLFWRRHIRWIEQLHW